MNKELHFYDNQMNIKNLKDDNLFAAMIRKNFCSCL